MLIFLLSLFVGLSVLCHRSISAGDSVIFVECVYARIVLSTSSVMSPVAPGIPDILRAYLSSSSRAADVESNDTQ